MLATEIDTHIDLVSQLATEYQIEPTIWIGKKNLFPFVKDFFPLCTIVDKDGLVAGTTSHKLKLSIATINELASYWDSEQFRAQRANLLEEFNRYPTLDNMRALDREILLRQLQMQIFSLIKRQAPDFLLALDTPHNPVNLSAFYLAQWLNVPTLFFSGAGSLAPSLIPSTNVGLFDREKQIISAPESEEEKSAIDFNLKSALKTLQHLSAGVETHWQSYESELSKEHQSKKFEAIKDFKVKVSRSLLRNRKPELALFADLIDRNYARLVDSHASLPSKVGPTDHGLLTLHYQPEASTVPSGLGDTFQGEFVLKARKILPPEMTLVVKEHPSQLKTSMEGSFGRSPGFYDFVNALPNTKVISAFSQAAEILKTTRMVFTLTGSIGIEAATQGVPVVYFGAAWWGGMPGSFKGSDPDLDEKLRAYEAPGFDAISQYLLDILEHYSVPGFADSGARDYWNQREAPPERFQQALTTRLARTVKRFADGISA